MVIRLREGVKSAAVTVPELETLFKRED